MAIAIVAGVNGNSYRNGAQAVGEGILLNFVRNAVVLADNVAQTWFFDFETDDNYVLTGLEVTKTVAGLTVTSQTVGQSLSAIAWRVGPGTDAAATATNAMQATLCGTSGTAGATTYPNSSQLGRRVMAGVKDIAWLNGVAIAAILSDITEIGGSIATATSPLGAGAARVTSEFIGGVAADPMVRVLSTTAAVGTVTKQRIRLAISTIHINGGGAINPTCNCSCFVKIKLAKFSDVIPLAELVQPPVPTGSSALVS
jgi:hypothetical protein